jgi:hypothetical protein
VLKKESEWGYKICRKHVSLKPAAQKSLGVAREQCENIIKIYLAV